PVELDVLQLYVLRHQRERVDVLDLDVELWDHRRLQVADRTAQRLDRFCVAPGEHVEVGEVCGDSSGESLPERWGEQLRDVALLVTVEAVEMDAVHDQPTEWHRLRGEVVAQTSRLRR